MLGRLDLAQHLGDLAVGVDHERRALIAFIRFPYMLREIPGALALNFRLAIVTRSTKDIDLGRDDDEQAAIHDITAAQQLAMDDYFTFAATIHTSHSLAFAGIEPLAVPAIPIPQHLAEKVHAYTRTYGQSRKPSTRPRTWSTSC